MKLTGLEALLAEREIRQCLARYCRGIDRMDRRLLESVYWPDAVDDHDVWSGPPDAFIEWVLASLIHFDQSVHMLGQSLIEFVSPTEAQVETYLFNYLRPRDENRVREVLLGGRYLDVFTRRDGEWRIQHRRLVTDWVRDAGEGPSWDQEIVGHVWRMGARKPDDLSYQVDMFTP